MSDPVSFETALQNLEKSVQTLEQEGLTLEEALKTIYVPTHQHMNIKYHRRARQTALHDH